MVAPIGCSIERFHADDNPVNQHSSGDAPGLLQLPEFLLLRIAQLVATGRLKEDAAFHAADFGKVCVLTHRITHNPDVQRVIKEGAAELRSLLFLFPPVEKEFKRPSTSFCGPLLSYTNRSTNHTIEIPYDALPTVKNLKNIEHNQCTDEEELHFNASILSLDIVKESTCA
ncbi:MAG: hypothetical protein JSR46_08480, partial [Verrucomicrobia bacterium]|nr:hypothetical protein [Verrucomicrobiota bacterium]